MTPFIDYAGFVFGKLTVVEYHGLSKNQKRMWLCKCECGVEKIILFASLKNGTTNSCGCSAKEMLTKRNFKHGGTVRGRVSAEYRSWSSMKSRCQNEKCPSYPVYGGAGISVCERWLSSFDNFLEDMGLRPTSQHSLDRFPDMNGNYCPENCRWATKKEQKENQKVTVWLEFNGIKLTQRGWAQRWGVQDSVIAGHRSRGKSFSEIYNYFESGNSKKAKFYST